jgi:hypothetical protein
MYKAMFKPRSKLIFLLMGLLCFWGTQVMAQVPEKPDPPSFITELVNITELTQEQMEQMRSDGLGWGNIMIATRLAERIAADSGDTLTFEEALTLVLNARAEGKGFGQIAHENDLKLGRVLGEEETSDSTNPPPFINELVEITELTPEQLEQMRSDGLGWGNIMIAARLAERIAADSGGVLTFEDALTGVLDARTEGKGFGQIAHENDLKLGRVVGNGNKGVAASSESGGAGAGPVVNIERKRNQEKKQNVFGHLSGLLGFNKEDRPEKPSKPEKAQRLERPDKPERPEKPEKPEKPERPEKPEKIEKPEKPEKPERPPKPQKA